MMMLDALIRQRVEDRDPSLNESLSLRRRMRVNKTR